MKFCHEPFAKLVVGFDGAFKRPDRSQFQDVLASLLGIEIVAHRPWRWKFDAPQFGDKNIINGQKLNELRLGLHFDPLFVASWHQRHAAHSHESIMAGMRQVANLAMRLSACEPLPKSNELNLNLKEVVQKQKHRFGAFRREVDFHTLKLENKASITPLKSNQFVASVNQGSPPG